MSKVSRMCAVLLLGLWAASGPLGAATITVDTDKDNKDPNDGKCSLREALQAAFEDKKSGNCPAGSGADEIQFAGPAASGTIEIADDDDPFTLSSPLTLKGPATISGGKRSRVFEVGASIPLRLEKMTVINGFEEGGGAGLAVFGSGGTTEIVECQFTGNLAKELGGAVLHSGGSITIQRSAFKLNKAGTRGGALAGGGVWKIEDTELSSNIANGGGAIYCSYGALGIERSSFLANSASGKKTSTGWVDGGGAVMSGCSSTIENVLFETNFAGGRVGGGALLQQYSELQSTVVESVFKLNSAWLLLKAESEDDDKVTGGGGAIHAQGSLLVDRCSIDQNIARASHGGAGLLFNGVAGYHTVVNTVLLENMSTEADEILLNGMTNEPGSGGGISVVEAHLDLVASSLYGNKGRHELILTGNGTVNFATSLIDGPFADETCHADGSGALLNDQDAHNVQWAVGGNATCPFDPAPIGSTIKNGQFNAVVLGQPLKFRYVEPAAEKGADKKGSGDTCNSAPVSSFDLLGTLRPDKDCTIGAVELGGI